MSSPNSSPNNTVRSVHTPRPVGSIEETPQTGQESKRHTPAAKRPAVQRQHQPVRKVSQQ